MNGSHKATNQKYRDNYSITFSFRVCPKCGRKMFRNDFEHFCKTCGHKEKK